MVLNTKQIKYQLIKKITQKFNKIIEFKQPEVNIIQMNDEYDVNEMRTILQNNNNSMVNSIFGGGGKTTGIKNSGYKILFITPFNKLCQELRKDEYEAITLNELLDINCIGVENEFSKTKPFDIEIDEAIGYDEILLESQTVTVLFTL